jgi:hypothetical protein
MTPASRCDTPHSMRANGGRALLFAVLSLSGFTLSVLPGCGQRSEIEGNGSPSTDLATTAEFVSAYVRWACDYSSECSLSPVVRSAEECKRETALQLESNATLNTPTIYYDAAAARRCFEVLSNLECDDYWTAVAGASEDCNAIFFGKFPLGGTCSYDEECEPGLHCDRDEACPGTCQPIPGLGEACSGSECNFDQTCFNGLCQHYVPEGGACGNDYPECEPLLRCPLDAAVPTCTSTPAAAGEQCLGLDCIAGYVCGPSPGAAIEYTCLQPLPLGAVCTEDSICASETHCSSNTTTAGTCIADLPLGGACDEMRFDQCAVGWCIGGTCSEQKELGSACSDDFGCYSFHCMEGTCRLRPACE